MKVSTHAISGEHTLVFENGKRILLTKSESVEFEQWFEKKKREE